MAFIWSSIHKLKPRVLNHSLVCYKSLHFKTAFDQKASTNWFLQLGEIAISHFSTSDRKEAEKNALQNVYGLIDDILPMI